MNLPVFFASLDGTEDFSDLTDAILLVGTLEPIALLRAFYVHGALGFGCLQFMILLSGGILQWRLTCGAWPLPRCLSLIPAYLAINLVFTWAWASQYGPIDTHNKWLWITAMFVLAGLAVLSTVLTRTWRKK